MIINGYEIKDGVLDLENETITIIEDKAFLSARPLRSVILPSSVEHIGDWAFSKCTNLLSVKFAGPHRPGLFGRNVFAGCEKLGRIEFSGSDPVTSKLLALCTNRLAYDHLLRSDDVGLESWYAKWDISLESVLRSDDAQARMSAALCGEEDISYDGIGSVDGEMPGETGDFVQKEEFRKCSLCYIRLSNDRYLREGTRKAIEDHIRSNRLGAGNGSAFYSVFEEGDDVLAYLRIYLDTVKPDARELKEMIAAVPTKDVYARSYLINESGPDDPFGKLMLDY